MAIPTTQWREEVITQLESDYEVPEVPDTEPNKSVVNFVKTFIKLTGPDDMAPNLDEGFTPDQSPALIVSAADGRLAWSTVAYDKWSPGLLIEGHICNDDMGRAELFEWMVVKTIINKYQTIRSNLGFLESMEIERLGVTPYADRDNVQWWMFQLFLRPALKVSLR